MDDARQRIIWDIRRDLCADEGGELGRRTNGLKDQLSSAAQRLAEDLYATSTHFIMELVQNADDNSYGAHATPFIQFFLRPDYLLVSNNENGFEEDNVRALCSLGKSTKAKKQGYIGEKGIGFKSVFVWTDEPHVLSNGFDFKFKHGNITPRGELGFLVPYSPCRSQWPEDRDMTFARANTMFYLPFRERGDHSRAVAATELAKQFRNDMQPETVLFLRKLDVIKLWFPDGPDGGLTNIVYKRELHPNGIDVLVEKQTVVYRPDRPGDLRPQPAARVSNLYKRGAHDYLVPPQSREQRRNYGRTSIMLAFPTHEDGQPNVGRTNAVFAFLPVRSFGFRFVIQVHMHLCVYVCMCTCVHICSFGFRFVIQADFLLVANREDIIKENVWNEFLRDMLPDTFLRLFPALFKDDPKRQLQYSWVRCAFAS